LAGLRLDPNPSAVHLNDALRYGEAQAGAALLAGGGIVGLLEFLKQLCLVGSGDAGSGVSDRYMECAIVCFGDFKSRIFGCCFFSRTCDRFVRV